MDNLQIDPIIINALKEDLTWGDVTSEHLIPPDCNSELYVLLKEDGVIAGLNVARRTFELVDAELKWTDMETEGSRLKAGTRLARVYGNSRKILAAERTALNLMQRMSGIATLTLRYVDEIRRTSSKTRLLDTRKTTPGLRLLEKYAVRAGGGFNHRYNLSDAVLIKDNHLAILKSIGKDPREAIRELRSAIPHTVTIEVEVDTIEQLQTVLDAGADTVLLDNMTCEELSAAVRLAGKRVLTEASGGVTLENVAQIAATGVDFISVGALTHSSTSLDISLDYL